MWRRGAVLSVMVVDDEEFLHDLYIKILDLRGHRVVATALNASSKTCSRTILINFVTR